MVLHHILQCFDLNTVAIKLHLLVENPSATFSAAILRSIWVPCHRFNARPPGRTHNSWSITAFKWDGWQDLSGAVWGKLNDFRNKCHQPGNIFNGYLGTSERHFKWKW